MNIYNPQRILVTGSAGFIGSNFVRFLLKADREIKIISLDKLTYAGNKKNLENLSDDSRHLFVEGDICDRLLVDKLLCEHDIDTVVHFAAESHVDRSITGPADFIQTNICGTFVLLEAVCAYWLNQQKWNKNSCRFHHISTDEVYGELGSNDPSFTENSPYKPSSPYSASKAAADHLVRAYFRTYNLPVTISNCSNNYGSYQHAEKLIPTVIRSCLEKKLIPIYGNGSNIRDWLYVEDHCAAVWAILQKGKVGETYNIGGDCEKNNLSLVKMICAIMDEKRPIDKKHDSLISFVKDRLGHDWRYAINAKKIKEQLLWRQNYSILEGLNKTVDYYLNV
jgi:dTDP-glucose 4,6-dehydratase